MNIGNALKEIFNLKFELPIKSKVISQCDFRFDSLYFKYLVLKLKSVVQVQSEYFLDHNLVEICNLTTNQFFTFTSHSFFIRLYVISYY
jgi:hypothetical protein